MKPSFLECPVSAFFRAGSQVLLKLRAGWAEPFTRPTGLPQGQRESLHISQTQGKHESVLCLKGVELSFGVFIQTMRLACPNGSWRRRMAFTALKIAVFAAMLNASVSTQTDEKPGRLSRIRARLQISFQN
jgi:hypothetical protein